MATHTSITRLLPSLLQLRQSRSHLSSFLSSKSIVSHETNHQQLSNPTSIELRLLLQNCHTLDFLYKVHTLLIVNGLLEDHHLLNRETVHCYLSFDCPDLALSVYHSVHRPHLLLQNLVIKCFSHHGYFADVLSLYAGLQSSDFTYPLVIKACAALSYQRTGKEVHGSVLSNGYGGNLAIQNALLQMYAKSGCMRYSRKVFDEIPHRDSISWNALIYGYSVNGLDREAFEVFRLMLKTGLRPSRSTFAGLIRLGGPSMGRSLHGFAVKCGALGEETLLPVVISMYCASDDLAAARALFEMVDVEDSVSWNSMISACSNNERADDERLTYQVALQALSQPRTEASPPEGLLAVPLLKHQRIALSWMVQKETASLSLNCCGGILADDQGLGKTVSMMSLLLTERPPSPWPRSWNLDDDHDDPVEVKGRPAGGTLVVCPTSVLRQWNEELHNKVTREANLSVLIYHGSKRTNDPYELANYDVVLTTYAIVGMEVPKQPLVDGDNSLLLTGKERKQTSSSDSVIPGALAKVRWFRVVLDEAQVIKNHSTQVARACWGLRAMRRWCLSGTPIQNSIEDLYSYFRFLRVHTYAVYASFLLKIKNPIYASKTKEPILGNRTNGYKKLQAVLKTILLRRTKETLLDGEPIVILPPKTITLKVLDFSKEERMYYQRLESEFRQQFQGYAHAGTIQKNYANILLMLLRLRQACGHPLLAGGFDENSACEPTEEMAICAICSDAPEDAVVTACGHVFRNQCIREHLTEDDSICPSTRCKVRMTSDSVFPKAELKGSPSAEMVNKPVSSTKATAAVEILRSLPATEKALVFSQWTKMLDLLEVPLTNSSLQYRRLDGTMSVADRDAAVKQFNTLPQVTVMLMSLKAASLGLNMVAANHVLLLDPWWNPATEDQAIDRAHRIGQTRPVTVSRLTVAGTVEDRVLALQHKKRRMAAWAFGEESRGRHTRLTVDDLKYLFRV